MTAATLTIADFLLARIAEDEAALICCHGPGCANQDYGFAPGLSDCDEMVVNPQRWAAECKAKRRIVELHDHGDQAHPSLESVPERNDPCDTLRHLAAVYADHPEFREEWRV